MSVKSFFTLGFLTMPALLLNCSKAQKLTSKAVTNNRSSEQGVEPDNKPTPKEDVPLQPDIDVNAPFMLIPKPDDIVSEKEEGINTAKSLYLHHGGTGGPSPSPSPSPAKATGTGNSKDFYIGINKNEISKKWFLSAATKQLYPSQYAMPYMSLGTRIVSFTQQNGKLYVCDMEGNRDISSISTNTIIIDAYPIIPLNDTLRNLGITDQFIIIDPAAGISGFSPVADYLATISNGSVTMKHDINFLRDYKRASNGIYFEMVFSGLTNALIGTFPEIQDPNPTRIVGSLGITLRPYQETPGFARMSADSVSKNYYFSGVDLLPLATQAIPGGIDVPLFRWGGIKQGMSPIQFLITPQIMTTQQQFPQYDIVGSVIKGVESWNDVFGFKVLSAKVGSSKDSWAQDDLNMIIWDDNNDLGYAYADLRPNPMTGEIRGANVYMDAGWVVMADNILTSARSTARITGDLSQLGAKKESPKLTGFSWGSMRPHTLCRRQITSQERITETFIDVSKGLTAALGGTPTPKQLVENFIAHVIAHEVGHTLSLRHNFMGSNHSQFESSSVMDYLQDGLAAQRPFPGVYDKDAIRYLYGLQPNEPNQKFCTDEDLGSNPDCRMSDFGVNPLDDMILPSYGLSLQNFFTTGNFFSAYVAHYFMNQALDYVQGSGAKQKYTWDKLATPLKPNPQSAGREDKSSFAQILVMRAFLDADPDSYYAEKFIANPKFEPTAATSIASDLALIACNMDNKRTMQARREAVDALKRKQDNAGLIALNEVKVDLTKRIATLPANDALIEKDLLTRVEKSMNPYFK